MICLWWNVYRDILSSPMRDHFRSNIPILSNPQCLFVSKSRLDPSGCGGPGSLRKKQPKLKRFALMCLDESPPATWTFCVEALYQRRKGRGLRNRHNSPEGQRSAMSVVAVSDSSYGVAKDLNG